VVTPGTPLDPAQMDAADSVFVLALAPQPESLVPPTSTPAAASSWPCNGRRRRWERCRDDIGAMRPREILVPAGAELPAWLTDAAQPEAVLPRAALEPRVFEPAEARRLLLGHFGVVSLEAFGCEGSLAQRRRGRRVALRARRAEARPHARHRPRHAHERRRPRRRRAHAA